MLRTQCVRPGRSKSSLSYSPVAGSSSHTMVRALYVPMPSAWASSLAPPGPMQMYSGRLCVEEPFA